MAEQPISQPDNGLKIDGHKLEYNSQKHIENTTFDKFNIGQAKHRNATFNTEVNNGNSGTGKTIDWNAGNKQTIVTTASGTLTFIAPSGPCNLLLRIVHEASATAYTYGYPATVKWSGGTKPSTTNTSGAVDIIAFYFDGTNYYGAGSTNFS
jgi:hypothetical protein